MKKILALAAPFFFAALPVVYMFSCTKKIISEEEKERQKIAINRISKVTEFATTYHLGIPDEERINFIDRFDQKGYRIRSEAYGEFGQPERIMELEYDQQGRVITVYGLSPDKRALYKETRAYGKNKRELYFYLPDGSYKYRNIAAYDDYGRMTELRWYWPEGLKAINRYIYDNMNMVENCEYGPDEVLRYKWTYKYDKENNLAEATQYPAGDGEGYKISYNYNSAGLLEKQVSAYTESALPMQKSTVFEYDRKNLLSLKKEFNSAGKLTAVYRYSYEFY